MSLFRTIVLQDFRSLTNHWQGLMALVSIPVLFLFLIPHEEIGSAPVRLLVAGVEPSSPKIQRLLAVLRETSELQTLTSSDEVVDPLSVMRKNKFDLVLNYEGANRSLSIYSAETDPLRLQDLEKIAAGIWRASSFINFKLRQERNGQEPGHLFSDVWWAKQDLYEDLFMLGSYPISSIYEYYPQAAEKRVTLLPATITLVLCLIPFLLALAWGYGWQLNEVQANFKQIILVVASKSIMPAAVGILAFLLTLLVAEIYHAVNIKAGFLRVILLLLPATVSGSVIGFGISRLALSPLGLILSSALFPVLIIFQGGTFIPLNEEMKLPQGIAYLLPSTFAQPVIADWIFGSPLDLAVLQPLSWLLLQCVLYVLLAAVMCSYSSRLSHKPMKILLASELHRTTSA